MRWGKPDWYDYFALIFSAAGFVFALVAIVVLSTAKCSSESHKNHAPYELVHCHTGDVYKLNSAGTSWECVKLSEREWVTWFIYRAIVAGYGEGSYEAERFYHVYESAEMGG